MWNNEVLSNGLVPHTKMDAIYLNRTTLKIGKTALGPSFIGKMNYFYVSNGMDLKIGKTRV